MALIRRPFMAPLAAVEAATAAVRRIRVKTLALPPQHRQVQCEQPALAQTEQLVEAIVPEGRQVARGESEGLGGQVDALADGTGFEQEIAVTPVAESGARSLEVCGHHESSGRAARLVLARHALTMEWERSPLRSVVSPWSAGSER